MIVFEPCSRCRPPSAPDRRQWVHRRQTLRAGEAAADHQRQLDGIVDLAQRTDSPIIRCADDVVQAHVGDRTGHVAIGPADVDRVLGVHAVELIVAVCG